MLYRAFWWDGTAQPDPLAVPRHRQGAGRHDNPDHYSAVYLARQPIAAVAESIAAFRNVLLTPDALRRGPLFRSLATIDDSAFPDLIDLDDPGVLIARGLRPSRIATGVRSVTQQIALDLWDAGAGGISWWSTLEAMWTNVTIFRERLSAAIDIVDATPLEIDSQVIVDAADHLGVQLPRPAS